jgi:hypothetical protein
VILLADLVCDRLQADFATGDQQEVVAARQVLWANVAPNPLEALVMTASISGLFPDFS